MDAITQIACNARQAANILQTISTAQKSKALNLIHSKLASAKPDILLANKTDKDLALEQVQAGKLSSSLYKRLDLEGPGKFETMLQGILDIDQLEDPAGKVQAATKLDNGLELYRVSCPVGVLLVIFEARPEVVVNIAALAIKSGNAAILKGGKESFHTCSAISKAIREALEDAVLGDEEADSEAETKEGSKKAIQLQDAVQIVESRQDIDGLLKQDKYIDLVIPRGSNALVKYIQWNTRIPVLGHADGLCSTYVAASAKLDLAKKVVVDAKTTYPAACNSTETLLVHSSHLDTDFFQQLAQILVENNVTLKCDARSLENLNASALFKEHSDKIQASNDEDYDTEFLELTLAVKVVDSVEAAMEHINEHGSKHTDAILTESEKEAKQFMAGVDAAGVYWNASTRFADGFRYGFGAEVGVSTNKTHARGPVGLEGLVIYKYQLHGNGHASADYGAGEGKRPYLHEKIAVQEKETLGELSRKRQRLD
ncbi:glutamate-5-semialdehyde dehydrogenase [Entomortierella parvispora]|uniref:glutamate-5-semialdehyde dehydrogenase n=1 Tax=Entomortierella parvispora TaxID=205924 RepID=A0A9P3LUU9_9FUNG|nr:glutamate-5-semialdehyde dehydrogenase [Entomortierella parvispora]